MKKNNTPMRRCVGCMESRPKQELLRIAFYEGKLSPDLSGRAKGRGVYLCKDPRCFETALKKKALQRSFKTSFKEEEVREVLETLKELAENGKGE